MVRFHFHVDHRCQETLERHNETLGELMRSELRAEFDVKSRLAESQYLAETSKLR